MTGMHDLSVGRLKANAMERDTGYSARVRLLMMEWGIRD